MEIKKEAFPVQVLTSTENQKCVPIAGGENYTRALVNWNNVKPNNWNKVKPYYIRSLKFHKWYCNNRKKVLGQFADQGPLSKAKFLNTILLQRDSCPIFSLTAYLFYSFSAHIGVN